ncbi:type II toxin-antitoxin system RelE/ParE family toxin [Vibrio vulnificus]|nr:type II toxin-antitoxin system RelE/ParE family toxin [Vibrio vulnificus]MCU8172845.1 type II toxin-antitoxin system RelE/ParE family toxin [Vibrio vulnificus]
MKEVVFEGDSYKKLENFPQPVREKFVQDLEMMKYGMQPLSTSKPMNGLGKGVFELKKNGKPAYRLVYVIRGDIIHVVHVFSKTSNGTDKKEEDTIKQRVSRI